MRKLVLKGADANLLREAAIRLGMKTLLQSGTEKIRAGMTTLNEVLRVTQEA